MVPKAVQVLGRLAVVFWQTPRNAQLIIKGERTGTPEHFTASIVGHQSARSAIKLTYVLYSAGISDEQKRGIIDQVGLP